MGRMAEKSGSVRAEEMEAFIFVVAHFVVRAAAAGMRGPFLPDASFDAERHFQSDQRPALDFTKVQAFNNTSGNAVDVEERLSEALTFGLEFLDRSDVVMNDDVINRPTVILDR